MQWCNERKEIARNNWTASRQNTWNSNEYTTIKRASLRGNELYKEKNAKTLFKWKQEPRGTTKFTEWSKANVSWTNQRTVDGGWMASAVSETRNHRLNIWEWSLLFAHSNQSRDILPVEKILITDEIFEIEI